MRILSWNLWWRYGPWERRREAIAATLAQVGPDLCGLQEVWAAPGENLAADLAGRLGRHWCWAVAATGTEGLSIGNAILSRWPITAHAEASLPPGGLAEEARVAVHARIEAPGGALPLVTTRLTHRPGRSQVRTAQVRTLAVFVAEHAADCAYPPVVTGDLNAEPGSDELRLLGGLLTTPAVPGLVLIDARRYADPGDPGFTWDHRNGYQANTVLPDSRIDYILDGLPRQGRGKVRSAALAGTPQRKASGHRIISPSSPTCSSSQPLRARSLAQPPPILAVLAAGADSPPAPAVNPGRDHRPSLT